MLERGATTAWEWWDAVGEDGAVRGSLNHYSKAAVVSFLYTHIAGIRLDDMPDAESAAYRRVRIAPMLGGGLTWARASIETSLGAVRSEWRIDGDDFTLDVEVPGFATIVLPDGSTHDARRGIHSFTCQIDNRKA